ncbi:MAG: hypothetical protein RR572_03955, partial [Raoultibacter sp.]
MSGLHRKSVARKRRSAPQQSSSPSRRPSTHPPKTSCAHAPAKGSKRTNSTYNKPQLWTKNAPTPTNPVWAALRSIGSFLAAALMFVVGGLAHAARFVFGGLFNLIRRSKVALIVVAIAVLVLAGVAVDTGLNWGKVYPGVKVGSVDVGGKTA